MARSATALSAVMLFAVLLCARPLAAGAGADPFHLSLIDQRGRPVRLADFVGRPVAVTFVATRCTDGCPIANAVFASLEKRLRRDHISGTLLTITLDPDHDSPMTMARLASTFEPEASDWHFLSGAPGDVCALMRAFGVTTNPDANGIPEEHSSFVYLLDAKGRLSRTLLLSTNLPGQIAAIFGRPPLEAGR